MKSEYFLISLFFLVTAIFFYLFYQIIIPFFVPIAWASVLSILFYPLYEKIRPKVRSDTVASLAVCLIVVILIIGPVTYLFAAIVNEAADAMVKVNALHKSGELYDMLSVNIPWLETLQAKLSQYYDLSKINLDEIARDSIDKVSGALVGQTTWLVTNGTKAVFFFALTIFTLYYFFKEGEEIVRRLKRLMPLSPEQVDASFIQLRDIIQATMYGGVILALAQGLIGGILFWAIGIPSPVFWGAVMAFLSIIPFVGAFIIYVPAGLILIVGGAYVKGLIVIAVGVLIISQIDNVLRPYLIAGKTCLHPLLLFFAIMGGIAIFGLLGLVIGPLISAVFLTILQVFELKLHPESETITDSG